MRYSLLAMTRSVIVLFASFLAAAAGAPSHSPVGTWAWPAAGYSCVEPWVRLSERDVTYLGNGLGLCTWLPCARTSCIRRSQGL